MISLFLFACIAFAVAQQQPTNNVYCPTLPPAEPYWINAAGYVMIGFRTQVPNIVSATGQITLANGARVNEVYGGAGVEVGWDVFISSGFIWVTDRLDVMFEVLEFPPAARVCETAVTPPTCEATTQNTCPSLTVPYDTTANGDLVVYSEQFNNYRSSQPVYLDGRVKNWRNVQVQYGATLVLGEAGTWSFNRLEMDADSRLILNGTNGGNYLIMVNQFLDVDERVSFINENSPEFQNLTFYQFDPSGYVYIGNAASNRNRFEIFNIASRAEYLMGGYVQIGIGHRIRGYIASLGDVILMHDTRYCFNGGSGDACRPVTTPIPPLAKEVNANAEEKKQSNRKNKMVISPLQEKFLKEDKKRSRKGM